MSDVVFDIRKYEPKSDDIFFFDNNIWMFLFAPLVSSHSKKQQTYTEFFGKIRQSRATIFTTPLILSEFANSCINIQFGIWKKNNEMHYPKMKDKELRKKIYYKTLDFKQETENIKSSINSILNCAEKVSDSFNSITFLNVLDYFGESDFNDSYYIELARFHHCLTNPSKWKIVTDDADLFKINTHRIPIYSANI
jgi:hypothetical protein